MAIILFTIAYDIAVFTRPRLSMLLGDRSLLGFIFAIQAFASSARCPS